eukprot:Gb_24773 [translate_table: standard]
MLAEAEGGNHHAVHVWSPPDGKYFWLHLPFSTFPLLPE